MFINKQVISVKCDACGVIKQLDERAIYENSPVSKPCLPRDWTQVNNDTYCPKHKVMIHICGKED